MTVLDISGNSIEEAKSQLNEKSNRVIWVEADITKYVFQEQYDVWHDRAVFHFLTKTEDRKKYINSLNQALKLNGQLIMATFSLDAPPKCSGLSVVRYRPELIQNELRDHFTLIDSLFEDHVAPSGATQPFIFCRFNKHK